MRRFTVVAILLAMLSCERQPSTPGEMRITSARRLTALCAKSRLSKWHVRARAAGNDCNVLLITTSVILEDSMIEALHYGAGAYDVYPGGVQQFSRERAFRGVAYRDASGRVWTYGALTPAEADSLEVCH